MRDQLTAARANCLSGRVTTELPFDLAQRFAAQPSQNAGFEAFYGFGRQRSVLLVSGSAENRASIADQDGIARSLILCEPVDDPGHPIRYCLRQPVNMILDPLTQRFEDTKRCAALSGKLCK
ncbi:hypothetical protein TSA6c_22550 [Azospirillum sp. TSA6c]|nr:hypothetical protein TSA6c_22550 [Azospirillum sp. TSA6c]